MDPTMRDSAVEHSVVVLAGSYLIEVAVVDIIVLYSPNIVVLKISSSIY